MKVSMYTASGEKKGQTTLPKLFETEASPILLKEALLRQQGNARVDTASTKTRTEVRGGGRKPWRQKGTGRARQGSIRSAQWKGGGVIFGPRGNRNYSKNMPKKMRRKALFGALHSRLEDMIVLDSFTPDVPKTKEAAALLKALQCERRTLIVLPASNATIRKSFANIPFVKVITAQYLNIADILFAQKIVFFQDALKTIETHFSAS